LAVKIQVRYVTLRPGGQFNLLYLWAAITIYRCSAHIHFVWIRSVHYDLRVGSNYAAIPIVNRTYNNITISAVRQSCQRVGLFAHDGVVHKLYDGERKKNKTLSRRYFFRFFFIHRPKPVSGEAFDVYCYLTLLPRDNQTPRPSI
jgi:hypothetical protein